MLLISDLFIILLLDANPMDYGETTELQDNPMDYENMRHVCSYWIYFETLSISC